MNERQQAARRKRLAKLRRSPEHREALRVAKKRSGNRCEFDVEMAKQYGHQVGGLEWRCGITEGLHFHHTNYRKPKGVILCSGHHMLIEWHERPQNRGRIGR